MNLLKKILNYLLAVTFIFSAYNVHSQDRKLDNALKKYNLSLIYLNQYYIDSVNIEQLVERSILNTIQTLDPHSSYISKEEYKAMNEPLEGNFEGIGIEFNILEDTLIVVTPIAGGPSEKVGLRSRDRIVKVNGEAITNIGLTTKKVHSLLRGAKGSKIVVTVKRGGELIDFEIIRDKIPINSLDAAYEPENGIAYIKLSRFARNSVGEIMEAFDKFKNPKSLILDLRHNTGGYMEAAIELADQFLSQGKLIVYTEGLHTPVRQAVATEKGRFEKGNLVILIDENSASASEILAGAIQDWDRGLIIGRRSFGKGLIQNDFSLMDGSALRLTIARYHTPSGRAIQSPYEKGKKDKYYADFYSRFSSEIFHSDSIKFPDSLKFNTLVSKRTVYGGGGIMPDIYLPLDTSNYSKYSGELARKGSVFQFLSSYMDKHGNEMKAEYKTFETFKKSFTVSDELFNKMVEFAENEGVARNEEGIRVSGSYLKLYMKAIIARHLFDYSQYYMIMNDIDKEFLRAVEVLKNWNEYGKRLQ